MKAYHIVLLLTTLVLAIAKAFQTVTKIKTVSGKTFPSSHRTGELHSSTFYLPLLLKETLKISSHTEPIPRGVPILPAKKLEK